MDADKHARLDNIKAEAHDKAVDELEQCLVTILNFATNAECSNLYASEVTEIAIRALFLYTDEPMIIGALGAAAGLQMK